MTFESLIRKACAMFGVSARREVLQAWKKQARLGITVPHIVEKVLL